MATSLLGHADNVVRVFVRWFWHRIRIPKWIFTIVGTRQITVQ